MTHAGTVVVTYPGFDPDHGESAQTLRGAGFEIRYAPRVSERTPDQVVELMVDEVRHVVRLSRAEIEVTGSVLGADLSDHVLGVGRPEGDFVVLLDLASMVET